MLFTVYARCARLDLNKGIIGMHTYSLYYYREREREGLHYSIGLSYAVLLC